MEAVGRRSAISNAGSAGFSCMSTVLLAHSDSQQRDSLAATLSGKGFQVIAVADIEAALDAATGAVALLVEPALLAAEEFEVKTRLDLRAGRDVRILALTHKAQPPEMAMFRRHGAGLLARPIEDVERIAAMIRIQAEAAAPWDGSTAKPTPPPADATPPPKSRWSPMPNLPPPAAPAWRSSEGPPPLTKKEEKKAKADADAKARADADAIARADAKARVEIAEKAKAEAKAKADAAAKAKLEIDLQAKAEAKAKYDADARAKADAKAKDAKPDAKLDTKADAAKPAASAVKK